MIRYNKRKKANEIALIEIFKSIDGEGFHAGQATVFVRTFGCNLRCSYCDTNYCFNEELLKKAGYSKIIWKTAKEILKEVEALEKKFKYKSICLTGGEPLMEENKHFMLGEFLPLFLGRNYAINIETNGSIDYTDYKRLLTAIPVDNYGNRIGISLIADYKLPASGMNQAMEKSNFDVYTEEDVVKMVITDRKVDWDELLKVCKTKTAAKLYLSPCFGKVDLKKIPEFIIKHPEYNITAQIQMHKVFWDPNKKGV